MALSDELRCSSVTRCNKAHSTRDIKLLDSRRPCYMTVFIMMKARGIVDNRMIYALLFSECGRVYSGVRHHRSVVDPRAVFSRRLSQ